MERRTGSPAQVARNWPQLQLAVRMVRSVISKPLIAIAEIDGSARL